ncbi:MAG: substrate-binding domain-containing protein [Victivallales bacterium]|nr:substrate-binding domain-containing protein [Victivallales bacterium]
MKNLCVVLTTVSLALSVLIGVVLAKRGGGEEGGKEASSRRILVGLSMDTLKEARWQRDRDLFVARAKELGADVKVLSANSDDVRQVQDVSALIASEVDVMVIIPHDGRAMAKSVDAARAAGIPVIAYDRLITDCDLGLYLTFDNVKVGEAQGRYLVDHLPTPGKGRIVRLYGAPSDNNAKLFKQGQDNVLAPYIKSGDIQVVHEDWVDDWDPQNAKKIMNAAMNRVGNKFDAVLASNDGTAGGAIQALKEEGLAGKRLVTGQDADLVACQRIAGGTQTMTIYKPVSKLARRAAELAVAMAKGEPVVANSSLANGRRDVPSVFLKVHSIDRDSLEILIKDEFHSRADIFGQVNGK